MVKLSIGRIYLSIYDEKLSGLEQFPGVLLFALKHDINITPKYKKDTLYKYFKFSFFYRFFISNKSSNHEYAQYAI